MSSPTPYRLAADIGGTFTDIVIENGERRWTRKILTTPQAPEEAVISGTEQLLHDIGLTFSAIAFFVHGTTLATNAIIERKGALTALITTQGFRDVIEIADESRYDQYDIFIDKPQPLVARALRFTVPERVDVHGNIRLALEGTAVECVATTLLKRGIEAVAVALLHSYANDCHERMIGAVLAKMCPQMAVTLSCDVCPEIREYERSSTAIANAYVQPLMAGYLGRLEAGFRQRGYQQPIHLMTSAGTLASIDTARRFPVRLVESGPAGGAILAAHVAAERGEDRVLSFDMGGTTAKICLIHDFAPQKGRSFEVDRAARFLKGSGLPLRIPVIEMIEIGAGGGSIARLDGLKRLTVGPDSAASVPGPACYGRGGTEPTVTDADLALGRIDPERFAGGSITLQADAAMAALERHIGAALQLETHRAAHGVCEIVDENMANAARVHSIERGAVASGHVLIAFGGAAPLHAARLAEKLGVTRLIIPQDAGVGSAIGFLRAPAAYEIVQSHYMRLEAFNADKANEVLTAMSLQANDHAAKAAAGEPLEETRQAFMRYVGQGHEIAISLPLRPLDGTDARLLRQSFEDRYRSLFTRHIPEATLEILSWSVIASTKAKRPQPLAQHFKQELAQASGTRHIFDAASNQDIAVPTYHRDHLHPGLRLSGPAIILEAGTSTFVSARFDAACDAGGALILTAKEIGQ